MLAAVLLGVVRCGLDLFVKHIQQMLNWTEVWEGQGQACNAAAMASSTDLLALLANTLAQEHGRKLNKLMYSLISLHRTFHELTEFLKSATKLSFVILDCLLNVRLFFLGVGSYYQSDGACGRVSRVGHYRTAARK